jgi:hypothetical protein
MSKRGGVRKRGRGGERGEKGAYNRRPDATNRHARPPLAFKIHSKPHGQHTHAHFPHSVRRLPFEEAGVNRWADDHDSPALAGSFQVRKTGLDGCVQAFWVHALHELEAFHGRVFHGRPPDCAGVVD